MGIMSTTHEPETAPASVLEESRLGKSIHIKGQVTGSEPVFVGGGIQGSISVPGARVTIGKDAQIAAEISAAEVIVLGSILGNVTVTDRVHVHTDGSVMGNITAQRLGVDDGAHLKGNVELNRG